MDFHAESVKKIILIEVTVYVCVLANFSNEPEFRRNEKKKTNFSSLKL